MTVLLVARNTFREIIRDRVLAGVMVSGFLLLGLTQLLSPLALGEGRRLTVDLGLTGISVLGFLVVLLGAMNLVSREIERRTIYNLLSRPVSRHAYLVGKWVGLAGALWVMASGLGLALSLTLAIRGDGSGGLALAQAVYLSSLELTVVAAVGVLFSALSTPVLSGLYTLAIIVLGQWSYDLRDFARHFTPVMARATEWAANLLPNLPLFNMRSGAANDETTSVLHLAFATAYALVYCACALCLATAAFESKDFK